MNQETDFRDLKREVWDKGICSGCGGCVAVCPADSLYFRQDGDDTCPATAGYCKHADDGVLCGACYAVCPRVLPPSSIASPTGSYLAIVSGQAAFDVPRRQSGGAVTAILSSALDEGLIDAVVTVTEDRWSLRPSSAVITSSQAVVHEAGSRYTWWVPLLAALKAAVIEQKFRRIAIVGLPCVVQAVDRIRHSDNDLLRPFADSIRLVIGLFCTESFDYRTLVGDILRDNHGIKPWEIERLEVAGKLQVTLGEGSSKMIPLKDLEQAVRSGCKSCIDLVASSADISAGSIGTEPGCTTIIVRTPVGEGFVHHAVKAGLLRISDNVDLVAIENRAVVKRQKNSNFH